MHANCQRIFTEHCLDYFKPTAWVLECGPGLGTPHWYEHQLMARDGKQHRRWDTVDVNPKRKDVTYLSDDPHWYGMIEADHYDIVFSSMVIEHTPRPWDWFKELARVCARGGLVVCLAPFIGPEHGADYFRVLPRGARVLAESAGLEVVEAEVYELEPGDWRGPDTVHTDTLLVARKP